MSVHNNVCGIATLYWIIGLHVSYSLCSETSMICLPAIFSFFLVVFVVMEMTHHSLVISQLSKRRLT